MQVRHLLKDKGVDVVGIAPGASLEAAAKLLSEKRIGAVVVREEGGPLLGILSERDLVKAMGPRRSPGCRARVADLLRRLAGRLAGRGRPRDRARVRRGPRRRGGLAAGP